MQATRPYGFGVLAVCSFACAVLMATLLGAPAPEEAWLPLRMVYGATGALALATAEALWFVRPWAFSASLAFAGTFVAMLFVVTGTLAGGILASAVAGFFIAIALSMVYNGLVPTTTPVQGTP